MGDLVERQQLGFVFCCSVWDFPYWQWSLHRIFDSELNYHFQGRTLIVHGLIYLPLPSYTLPPFYLYSGIPLGSMLFPNPFLLYFFMFSLPAKRADIGTSASLSGSLFQG